MGHSRLSDKNNNSSEKRWELVNFCEFDKYAVKSYCAIHNVDESLNLGDITKIDEHNISPFNMICGGSPCQDFSVAGKQKGSVWTCKDCGHEYNPLTVHWSERDKCPECGSNNIEKTRSSLLVEYLRVIRANKPNFGMYENVKNIVGKQFKETTFKLFTDELEEYGYNVYWKVLNAKDYGIPQNRERVYLIFIKKELDNGKFKYPEPFDNGIRLKDILESEVDEKFYISENKAQKFIQTLCINKSDEESNTPKFIGNVNRPDFGTGYAGGVWDSNNISPTLTTMQGGGRQPHIITSLVSNKGEKFEREIDVANTLLARDYKGFGNQAMNAIIENFNNKVAIRQATKKGYIECEIGGVADLSYPNSKTRRGRVQDGGNICPTLTATETDICRIESVNEFDNRPKERFFRQALDTFNDSDAEYGNTIDAFNKRVNKSGYSPTLTTRPEGFKTAILPVTNDIRIRKLTPKECFRLMGFSDENFEAAENVVSNSQLYKQAGNSIVVDVLYYILVELYKAMPYLFDDLKLSSFFSGIGAFEIALNRLYESINSENFTKPQVD
ncbi:DNA (cytosine-5-)-methyltransferase [Anaerobutyricum hallii]|uniref:DNA (cytosine-5-)-methyltransferase n=1 Tax=Anaerobutyricum hallii TaxID=39488 RepID=UPI002ED42E53